MFRTRSTRLAAAALAATLLATTPTLAQKKGKPGGDVPVPDGTIYFWQAGALSSGHFAMKADGSQLTALPITLHPSQHLHGGHRWFLVHRGDPDQLDPDGNWRHEVVAVRDDAVRGDTYPYVDPVVQMTGHAELQPVPSLIGWAANDELLAFFAVAWDLDTATPVLFGIYTAEIDYDESGNVIGLVAQPDPWAPAVEIPWDWTIDPWRLIFSLSFSPDATQVAWSFGKHFFENNIGDIYVTDLLLDPPITIGPIATDVEVNSLQWSPDGTQIAFSSRGNIEAIRPEGSGRTVIRASEGNSTQGRGFTTPYWSPDGAHITCRQQSYKRTGFSSSLTRDVVRFSADGTGGVINLTENLDGECYPTGWR